MSETITVTGLTETVESMEDLDKKVQKSIVRKGLRQGAKVVLNAVKAETPSRTGALRRGIKIRTAKARKGTYRLSVGIGAKDYVGDMFYGAFLLYGHKVGSRKLGDARKSIPPNDFIGRGFNRSHDEAADVAEQGIADLIEQEAAK